MDVVALAPGSFHLTMQLPLEQDLLADQLDLGDTHLVETSVTLLLGLFEAEQTGNLTEGAEDLAHSVGTGATKTIQRLLGDSAESGMSAAFDWRGGTEQSTDLTPAAASRLRDWLRSVEERTHQITILGTLEMGDHDVGKFKLVDLGGRTYEGKANPDLLVGKALTDSYEAVVDVTTASSGHTRAQTERYTLRALRPDPRGRHD